MRRQITLSEILTAFGDRLKSGTYYTLPGIVVQFYSASRTADIQPAVNDPRFDPDSGALVLEDFPILPKVPIVYPCGGGFEITWPLVQGDKVTLTAYDLDPTKHILTGNQEDPPNTGRQRGMFWKATPENVTQGQSAAGSSLTIGAVGGGDPVISFNGSKIQLGASPTDALALGSVVDKFIQTVMGWIPVADDGGAALKSALTTAGFSITSTSKSTLVQAK